MPHLFDSCGHDNLKRKAKSELVSDGHSCGHDSHDSVLPSQLKMFPSSGVFNFGGPGGLSVSAKQGLEALKAVADLTDAAVRHEQRQQREAKAQ